MTYFDRSVEAPLDLTTAGRRNPASPPDHVVAPSKCRKRPIMTHLDRSVEAPLDLITTGRRNPASPRDHVVAPSKWREEASGGGGGECDTDSCHCRTQLDQANSKQLSPDYFGSDNRAVWRPWSAEPYGDPAFSSMTPDVGMGGGGPSNPGRSPLRPTRSTSRPPGVRDRRSAKPASKLSFISLKHCSGALVTSHSPSPTLGEPMCYYEYARVIGECRSTQDFPLEISSVKHLSGGVITSLFPDGTLGVSSGMPAE